MWNWVKTRPGFPQPRREGRRCTYWLRSEVEAYALTGNKEGVQSIYDLAARLISCNREGIHITASELLGKYRMTLESAVVFFSAYMDYISAITNQKN